MLKRIFWMNIVLLFAAFALLHCGSGATEPQEKKAWEATSWDAGPQKEAETQRGSESASEWTASERIVGADPIQRKGPSSACSVPRCALVDVPGLVKGCECKFTCPNDSKRNYDNYIMNCSNENKPCKCQKNGKATQEVTLSSGNYCTPDAALKCVSY